MSDHIQNELRKLGVESAANQLRTNSAQQNYLAAVMMGDNVEADNIRLQMHALLDKALDIQARQVSLSSQLGGVAD